MNAEPERGREPAPTATGPGIAANGRTSWSWFAVDMAYFGVWLTWFLFGFVAWTLGGFALGMALVASNDDPLVLRVVGFLGWVGLGGPLLIGLLLWIARVWARPHGWEPCELGRAALLSLPLVPFAALVAIPVTARGPDWPWLAVPPGLAAFGTLVLLIYLALLGIRVVWAPNRAWPVAKVDP